MYVCIYIYIYIYIIYMYVCIYIYIYVYMYVLYTPSFPSSGKNERKGGGKEKRVERWPSLPFCFFLTDFFLFLCGLMCGIREMVGTPTHAKFSDGASGAGWHGELKCVAAPVALLSPPPLLWYVCRASTSVAVDGAGGEAASVTAIIIFQLHTLGGTWGLRYKTDPCMVHGTYCTVRSGFIDPSGTLTGHQKLRMQCRGLCHYPLRWGQGERGRGISYGRQQ
jgi:hypothetical protein